MKYCKEYAALLSGSVDEALTLTQERRLREHLIVCPDCRAYYQDLLALHRNFPSLEEVEVPVGFTASVMRAVRADQERRDQGEELPEPTPAQLPPQKRRRPLWKTLGPVAACLVLVVALGSQGLLEQRREGDAATAAADYAESQPVGESAPDAAPQDGAPQVNAALAEPTQENDTTGSGEGSVQQKTTGANQEPQTPEAYESLTPSQTDLASPGVFAVRSARSYFATLTLTQAQAGDLLATLTPAAEDAETRTYELDRVAYDQLLTDLTALGVDTGEDEAEDAQIDASVSVDQSGTLALVTIVLLP